MARAAAYLCVAATLVSCGNGLDEDTPIGEQLADEDDREEFVEGVIAGSGGTIAQSEAECIRDLLFATDITPGDLADAESNPDAPITSSVGEMLEQCVDPSLDVRVPIAGATRAQLAARLVASGWSFDEATCYLDDVAALGLDGRDITLSGVGAASPEVEQALLDAVADCF